MESASSIHVIISEPHPFISIIASSCGLQCGISIENVWNFNNDNFNLKNENYLESFRMILSTAYSKGDINDFQCSRYDTSFGITIFNTLFLENPGDKKKFYSLACFLDSKSIKSSPYINELIYQRMHFLGLKYQKYLTNNEIEMDQLTTIVRNVAIECTFIFSCGLNQLITEIPKVSNINFYSQCLTAHLQTQMTTIIETPDITSCGEIFSLLSCFLIEEQRNLSSQRLNQQPISGLFLQCVKPQREIPYQILFQFQRPWTWINIKNKTVICFSDFNVQQAIYKDYTTNFLFSNNINEQKAHLMFQKYLSYYKENQVTQSKLTDDIVKNLTKTTINLYKIYCNQKFFELTQRALILNDMCNEVQSNTRKNLLRSNEINIICQNMDIHERNELKIIVAISQLFDKHIYRCFFSWRKETIQQMVSCI